MQAAVRTKLALDCPFSKPNTLGAPAFSELAISTNKLAYGLHRRAHVRSRGCGSMRVAPPRPDSEVFLTGASFESRISEPAL